MDDDKKKKIEKLYLQHRNTDKLYENFIKNVKEKNVRNDGTNELLKFIDDWIDDEENSSICSVVKKDTDLFRARIIDENNLKHNQDISAKIEGLDITTNGFGESDSRECPLGVGGQGRNNIKGSSYIYLANRPETACVEVKPIVTDLISLARFKIMRDIKIIDFSKKKNFKKEDSEKADFYLDGLFTKIMRQYYLPFSNDDEYIATQFLTDYIRKKGFDGIAYGSYYDRNGVNYTIFNCDRQIVRFIDSKILLLQSEEKIFLDFDDKKIMKVASKGNKEYDEGIAARNGLMIQGKKNPRLLDLE